MFEYDRTLKILAARYPYVFQGLLFGKDTETKFLRVEDTAINIPERRPDKVFFFGKGKSETVVSFEFMLSPKQKRLQDFHIKNGLLTGSLRKPVVTVIIYLERGKYRTFPYEYVARLEGAITKTQFSRILLWEYKDKIKSGELWELAPLLVLLEDEPDEKTILEEKEIINRVSDKQERADLLGLAAMVAYRKFKKDKIKELFFKEYNMLKESSFVKDWLQESWENGREKGLQEGQEKGLQEGREKGLREGQLGIILKLLEKVLGRISSELEARIRALSDAEIERLSYDLLNMKKINDLEEWFKMRDKNSKN